MVVELYPVNAINPNSKKLELDLLSRDAQNSDILAIRGNQAYAIIRTLDKYTGLTNRLGTETPARLEDITRSYPGLPKELENIQIVRNHPIQYVGQVFKTVNGTEYGVSENFKLMILNRKSSLNGKTIDSIAGLKDTNAMHMIAGSDLESENYYNTKKLISQEGTTIKKGTFILGLLIDEAAIYSTGGFKTSNIDNIRPATAKELARYN